jgi:2-polyprenyl-3-methyl-5-hydroxy-6-metoxy-1,4-benzoquinol methylase
MKTLEKNLKDVLMTTIKSCGDLDSIPQALTNIFFEINDIKSRDYSDKEKYKRYLRAIARNMPNYKFKTLKFTKKMLEDWDTNKRLNFLSNMGEILIEFLYGHSHRYYQELDSNAKFTDKIRTDDKHYHYIALSVGSFVSNFLKPVYDIYEHRKSFIDVGCGIGDKTFLAWLSGLFDECYGIEYSKLTYEIANKHLLRLGLYDIIYGNAFKHNFKSYDTIYLYCPISDGENMHRLYEHIFGQMKVRAIMKEMLPESGMRDFLESNGVSPRSGRGKIIQKTFSTKYKKYICKPVKYPANSKGD